jgi:hypothetical protein
MTEVCSDQLFAFISDSNVFFLIDRLKISIVREFNYQDSPVRYLNSLLLSDPSDNLKPLILVIDTKSVTLYNGLS